jgi:hypothetical protein
MTSLTSTSSSLLMTSSCASCARWCHQCGFFFARLAGGAISSVARSISLAWDGVAPFGAHSPGGHCPRGVYRILRCSCRIRRLADCRGLHVRRVSRIRRICRHLVQLAGGDNCDCCDCCRHCRCSNNTSDSRCVVCAREAYSRAACLLVTVFAQCRGYRHRCSSSDRCWRAPRHRGATRGHRNRLFHR